MATLSKARSLHNGVSSRYSAWKSRTDFGNESQLPRTAGIKRWDGTAKTCLPWDELKKDPELWFNDGNCFVHLYGRGQSRRGPAFRVPLSALLAAKCQPLIDQFLAYNVYVPADPNAPNVSAVSPSPPSSPPVGLDSWSLAHLQGRVDLFIPAPPNATKDQILLHQLVIRNLFAWVFRRPIVGEHLGRALARLFHAMRQLRSPGADNVHALLSYITDAGYLYSVGQPDYALAVLHLAETMQVRDLYIDAFTHCVGMYNRLYLGSEYQHISPASRKLIRRARFEMDARLGLAGTALSNFLEDDLSAANLGLPTLARAHLDRFRTYVQGFYSARLGYYPPISLDARTGVFEPRVYRILSEDFQALYSYLADTSFTADSIAPARAQGGICVQQCVEAFDTRHDFVPLAHPLPLLPESAQQSVLSQGASGNDNCQSSRVSYASRGMTWLGGKTVDRLVSGRAGKLRPDKRLLANAALLKATNKCRPDLWNNDFIRAYCQFEEYSVMKPNKIEHMEKISLVDGRKVRWIFVYAVHQMLQSSFTAPPPEARDTEMAPYHTSVSTEALPPWKNGGGATLDAKSDETPALPSFLSATWPSAAAGGRGPSASMTVDNADEDDLFPARRSMSMTAMSALAAAQTAEEWGRGQAASPVFDIRPDIDYLGLAGQSDDTMATTTVPDEDENAAHRPSMLPRSVSLTRALSQKTVFRRSIGLFRSSTSSSARPANWRPLTRGGAQPSQDIDGLPDAAVQRPRTSHRLGGSRFTLLEPMLEGRYKQRTPLPHGRTAPAYHEIVVQGYGNGTNPVTLASSTTDEAATTASPQDAREDGDATDEGAACPSAGRSLSTASTASSTNSDRSAATAKSASTVATSVVTAGDAPVAAGGQPKDGPAQAAAPVATQPTSAAGLSRAHSTSSSVYSTVTVAALPDLSGGPPLPLPPPVPRRSSARHRRFSVHGNGSEHADRVSVPPVPALPALSALPALPTMAMRPVQVRHSSLGFAEKMYSRSSSSRPRTMNGASSLSAPPLTQRFDMVQEALRAVQETMEQHGMDDVDGMDDLCTRVLGTWDPASNTRTAMGGYRHSSYHERRDGLYTAPGLGRSDGHGYDNGSDEGVQPEWEKFSMGLGGHTLV